MTTGGCVPGAAATGAWPPPVGSAWVGRTSLAVGDRSRNSRANTTGAGARYRSHSRTQDWRAYSTAARTPTARAMPTSTGPRRSVSFLATWMASRVNSPNTAARCRKRRTVAETSPTTTSRAQMPRAGSRITPSTSRTMSSRSARRNRKKSGLLPVTSSSGWAMAKPHSTNSSTSAHSCSRSPHVGLSMSPATSVPSAHGERPQPHLAARVVDHEQLQLVVPRLEQRVQGHGGELVRRALGLAALGVAPLPEGLRPPGDAPVEGHGHRRPRPDAPGQADLPADLGRDQAAVQVDLAVLGQLLDLGAAGAGLVDPDRAGPPADQVAVGAELEPALVAVAGLGHLVGDPGQGLGEVLRPGEGLAFAGFGEEPLLGAGPWLLGPGLGDPVHLPRHLDPEHVGHRRDQVDVLPVAVVGLPLGLARGLDEQRHPQDLVDVARRGLAAAELVRLEAHAVVGRDHEQGVVVHALLLEPPHDLAEQPVGLAGLHQVALARELGRPGLGGPAVGVAAVAPVGVLAPVGQVVPGLVGEQQVQEVEARPVGALDRPHEVVVLAGLVALLDLLLDGGGGPPR